MTSPKKVRHTPDRRVGSQNGENDPLLSTQVLHACSEFGRVVSDHSKEQIGMCVVLAWCSVFLRIIAHNTQMSHLYGTRCCKHVRPATRASVRLHA